MKGKKLAILTPNLGALSETFIRKHIEQLLPGRTLVVASNNQPPYAGHWDTNSPKHIIGQGGLTYRLLQKIARRVGLQQRLTDLSIQRFLRQNQATVMMAEYLDFSLRFLPIAKALGIPFFAHAHGYDVSHRLTQPEWRSKYTSLADATGIITMNKPSKVKLVELGLPAAKIHIVSCGVEVPVAPVHRSTTAIVRCLAVGRMVPKKAPILLLESFRKASEIYPNMVLDYVGTGALLTTVKQYLRSTKLQDKVILHGGQSNQFVQNLMEKANIFLQHSMVEPDTGDEEGLPVAILEAMAQSLPVVSTFHAGIPEAVENNQTGFLVPEGDTSLMAEKIVALAENSELRHNMGLMAWKRAQQLFTWEKEKQQLLEIMDLL